MIIREIARRLRLAARAVLKPESLTPHYSPYSAAPHSMTQFLETDYRKKVERLDGEITVTLVEPATKTAFKLVGPASDQSIFLRIVHREGRWEPPVSRYIAERLQPGDVFIDIGANLGYFTALAAKRVAPGGCVHAFEASTLTRSLLEDTLRVNSFGPGLVQVHPVAAWHESATLQFRVSLGALGGNHVFVKNQPAPNRRETVEAHSVSAYLRGKKLAPLKLIKIDIEGAEIEALAGLKELLEAHPAEIVCEVNQHCLEQLGHSLDEFWDAVEALDCALFLLNGDASLTPLASREAFLERYPEAEGQHLDVVLRPRSL